VTRGGHPEEDHWKKGGRSSTAKEAMVIVKRVEENLNGEVAART